MIATSVSSYLSDFITVKEMKCELIKHTQLRGYVDGIRLGVSTTSVDMVSFANVQFRKKFSVFILE